VSELLRLTGVSKTYLRGKQALRVLKDANVHVQAGEVVCVLASHGEGGSTLLRIAAGIESADAGVVCFEGQDLAVLSDPELSRLLGERIAWVGKRGPRTGLQMFDYIALPLLARGGEGAQSGNWIRRWPARRAYRRTIDARVLAALERVGAAGCANQHWETMSDWERALCELAHAIAGEPALMVVDDLTDTLGMRETEDLCGLLRSLRAELGMGILMSVSDPHATVFSDRIMTLSNGILAPVPQGSVIQGPPPAGGKVFDFPDLGSEPRKAGHASSS
jgi:putative ABC transport system ATP-binding protein